MMLEEQLMKFSFFNKTGGFSIRKNSRSMIESMNYTAELLRDHRNMVLLFPQGKIESCYKQPILFEPGVNRIIEKIGSPVQIIFMANLIDYFSSRKPGIFMYIYEYKEDKFDLGSIQEAYNRFFNQCITSNSLKFND